MFWLGDCLEQLYRGRVQHGYTCTWWRLSGAWVLVQAGHPQGLPVIERQLEGLLPGGVPPLEYLFTTHQKTPHAGGLGRLVDRTRARSRAGRARPPPELPGA